MDLSSRKLSLKWNGDEYSVKHPSVKQHMSYVAQLQKKEGKEVEVLINFLDSLGLPKEASLEMDIAHLQQLMSALTGTDTEKK